MPTKAPTGAAGSTENIGLAWDDSEVDISWIDPNKKMIALTFDDGPAGKSSDMIMDVLERYGVHATFFYVGNRIPTYRSKVLRALELGCEIANHSYTHPNLRKRTAAQVREEVEKTNALLAELSGQKQFVFRCPGGNANTTVKNQILAPIFYWSIDTEDWKSRNCDAIVAKVLGKVKDGDIVLMHELYQSTAEAVEIIVPALLADGYQLVTVSELMKAKGISMQTGVVYYNGR